MKEKRLYWKRIVAAVCVIATLANFSYSRIVLGAAEETSQFLDLTFHDFGVQDNTYPSVRGQYHNAETLIGTRISGYVTLNEDLKNATKNAWLCFGFNGWGGVQLHFYPDGSLHLNTSTTTKTNQQDYVINPANIQSMNGNNFCGTRFKLTLSMEAADLDDDKEDDDVLLKLYINDEIAVANPLGNNALYGSNGEYYILNAVETFLAGYMITQYIGGEGCCSNITLESIADTTPYEIKALADFKLSDNTLGDSSDHTTASGSLERGTLDHLLIEGTYNFSSSNNMLFFGGAWSGFYIQPNGDTLLLFYKQNSTATAEAIGSITKTEIGAYVGTDVPISVGFRFVNKTSTTADVFVNLLIKNEYEYQYRIQGATLASLTDTLYFYAANGKPMSYSSDPYTQMSFKDFGMEDITTVRSGRLYSADSGSLDHVIIDGYYTFSDQASSNAVYFGKTWQGLRIENRGNNTLGFLQVDLANSVHPTLGTVSGNEIGLKLTDECVKMQVSFVYLNESDGVADVRVSVVFGDTYRVVYTMEDMHTSILERNIYLWSAGNDMPLTASVGVAPSPKLVEMTPADFGIADKTCEYSNGALSAGGALTNYYTNADEMDMNGKIISVDVAFLTSGPSLQVGGSDGAGWNGVKFMRVNDTQFCFTPTEPKKSNLQSHTLELSKTKLTSISEEFNLKISFEYIDHDGGGEKNDVRYGVWFNNRLYDETYFYSLNDSDYYGNWFGVYCPAEGNSIQISSPERTLSEYTTPYILEDFGVKERTYNQALIDELGTVDSYKNTIDMDMKDVSVSGRISVSKGADIRLFGKGAGNNLWEGYRFYIGSDDCLNLEHTCSEDTDADKVSENTVSLCIAFAEIQAGDMFDFTLSQMILDVDADGKKDDVRLGVWINDELYENRYYHLLDFSEYIQGGILIYPGQTGQIVVEDSVDVEIYNLANTTNKNGYLVAGKGNLTVNQVACSNGDVLSTPGDYIVRSGKQGSYVKQVVLYKSGDAHPDGVMDIRDLVATKKTTENIFLDSYSGEKAADVNADGKKDELDCASVRKHLIGKEVIIPAKDNFLSYDEDVMPIGGFFGPYRATETHEKYETRVFDSLTDDIFKKIQDLGVNLITYTENNYVSNQEDVILQLKLAEKYGIDVYLKDTRLTSSNCDNSQIATCVSAYTEYDSFKGLAVIDEPNTDYYGDPTERKLSDYATLATALNGYCNLNGKINLNPKFSSLMISERPSTWPSELAYNLDNAYETYVEEYIKTCNAKVLSTDFYVFDHLTTNSSLKTIDGYFNNLEVMRKNSVEHGVAFWNYIQAGSYFGKTPVEETNNEILKESHLLWNVNTSLAYGAKGIQYFPLIQPHYFAYEYTKTGNWLLGYNYTYDYDFNRNGLIGANGKETSWYWHAQKANKQIAAVDEVLMHTTSQDVLVVGATAQEETGKSASVESLAKYGLQSIAASNGAVVGVFDYQGKTAFYVVNYDYSNPQNITLSFAEPRSYSVISEQLSEAHTATSGNSCTLKLNAGGAALVIIN